MDPRHVPVSEVMKPEFMALSPKDDLSFVEEIMDLGRVRHFPVVDEGRLVGIVSHRDLLAASLTRVLEFPADHRRTFLRSVTVGEVMHSDVRTVGPDTPLVEVARILDRHKIGCVVVTEGTQAVGLVTETDLLAQAYLLDPD